ncbi:hypothetical protein CVT26_014887 [Gymnopilus dilepis]|uniref:Uncharacterized protein n=1 Tax=Gymnopilus dilepis TaxID=231916 RepID=A0A409XWS7_9AGAR|nr:hypothetical protein CVT26_014887 [Gymnopilus dilepis]
MLKVGIALYDQHDHRDRLTDPHWALVVAHASNYHSSRVRIYQLRFSNSHRNWVFDHKDIPVQQNALYLVGLLHVADTNMSEADFEDVIRGIPANRNGNDPSGLHGSANWNHRVDPKGSIPGSDTEKYAMEFSTFSNHPSVIVTRVSAYPLIVDLTGDNRPRR